MNSGQLGEKIAENYVKKLGYEIIARNFKSKRGEIDIIAKDEECIVFIEVKARNNFAFGQPVEAINRKKLNSIIITSQIFIQKFKLYGDIRYDAIEVFLQSEEVNHIKNITI